MPQFANQHNPYCRGALQDLVRSAYCIVLSESSRIVTELKHVMEEASLTISSICLRRTMSDFREARPEENGECGTRQLKRSKTTLGEKNAGAA